MANKKNTPIKQTDVPKVGGWGKGSIEDLYKKIGGIPSIGDIDKFLKMGALGSEAIGGTTVDTSDIDKQLAAIYASTGSTVWEKQAEMYRREGVGKVLRVQKNIKNIFEPAINLLKEREAKSQAIYQAEVEALPNFDDSQIFGDLDFGTEAKAISVSVKEKIRKLSRMNPMAEGYDELRKEIDDEQGKLLTFVKINEKLLEIANSPDDRDEWSAGMTEQEANMWEDIYKSNGDNIQIIGDKVYWVNPEGGQMVDPTQVAEFDMLSTSQKMKATGNEGLIYLDNNPYWLKEFVGDEEYPNQEFATEIQQALINIGYYLGPTGADGDWGPKSKAALKLYLEERTSGTGKIGELISKHSEGFEKIIDPTYSPETHPNDYIDLNKIGDKPMLVNQENPALSGHVEIDRDLTEYIKAGGTLDDDDWRIEYRPQIQRYLNSLSKVPGGYQSAIFDGVLSDNFEKLAGLDANPFLMEVIKNNFGEKLSEAEVEETILEMRKAGVDKMYIDDDGEEKSLKELYRDYYWDFSESRVGTRTSRGYDDEYDDEYYDDEYDDVSQRKFGGLQEIAHAFVVDQVGTSKTNTNHRYDYYVETAAGPRHGGLAGIFTGAGWIGGSWDKRETNVGFSFKGTQHEDIPFNIFEYFIDGNGELMMRPRPLSRIISQGMANKVMAARTAHEDFETNWQSWDHYVDEGMNWFSDEGENQTEIFKQWIIQSDPGFGRGEWEPLVDIQGQGWGYVGETETTRTGTAADYN